MRKVDLFWKSNDAWWEYQNHIPVLKATAPPEARESYNRYLAQIRKKAIWKINGGWKSAFTPHILAQGKQYFEEGCVSQVLQYGNRITAQVNDNEDYCVEVDLPGGLPSSWLCTCPYVVKGNCRHKAAVLFAVEAGGYAFADDSSKFEDDTSPLAPSPLPWRDAVENMPADMLRKFLLTYADGNEELQEYLSLWYLQRLPDGLFPHWKKYLQDYADEMSGGRRYVLERDICYFMLGVRSALKDRLLLLRKAGATMEAFYWLGTVFEIASQKVHTDKDGEFAAFYYACKEDWGTLFSEATDAQREQMLTWFWEHRSAFFTHAQFASDVYFLYLLWGDSLERKSLEIVDALIAQCHDFKELELLMDCRVEIMEFLDYSQEAEWAFWAQHLHHDYARYRLLDNYYSNPADREHITPLLKQLKEMDASNLPRLIRDSVWLAMWYKEENANDAYEAERTLLLTQCRRALETKLPAIQEQQLVACLDAMRSLEDEDINRMAKELFGKLCSHSAVSRDGIAEIAAHSGYAWPDQCT